MRKSFVGMWTTLFLASIVSYPAAVFAIVAFVTIHVYMLTTGRSFVGHVMPMITGFDEADLSPAEEAYLEADERGHIR